MRSRRLGKTGREVSEIGFGAWAIGGGWGETDDRLSLAAMGAAVDDGVTFFDTADVYGDGRSERLIAKLLRERSEPLVVATKFGRREPPEVARYTYENLRSWLERSRENLGVDAVDLVQLHCPPWETYYTPSVFEACDRLVEEGLVRAYGVSVEKVEEALKAIEYPGVVDRADHLQHLPPATGRALLRAGPSARCRRDRPRSARLGSADRKVRPRHELRTGRPSGLQPPRRASSTWARRSPASTSRAGSMPSRSCGRSCLEGATLAQLALRWILGFDAVSTVIPGAKTPEQARANAAASDLPALPADSLRTIAEIYRERIAPQVHQLW